MVRMRYYSSFWRTHSNGRYCCILLKTRSLKPSLPAVGKWAAQEVPQAMQAKGQGSSARHCPLKDLGCSHGSRGLSRLGQPDRGGLKCNNTSFAKTPLVREIQRHLCGGEMTDLCGSCGSLCKSPHSDPKPSVKAAAGTPAMQRKEPSGFRQRIQPDGHGHTRNSANGR